MRYKLFIQPYDDDRVLIYNTKGLSDEYINALNDFCLKNEIRDLEFATLDDNRVGVVAKPKTWLDVMSWNEKKHGKDYPADLKSAFINKCKQAMREGKHQKFIEELTLGEKDLKEYIKEQVDVIDDMEKEGKILPKDDDDNLWTPKL